MCALPLLSLHTVWLPSISRRVVPRGSGVASYVSVLAMSLPLAHQAAANALTCYSWLAAIPLCLWCC